MMPLIAPRTRPATTGPDPRISFSGFAKGKLTRGGAFPRFRNRDGRANGDAGPRYVFAVPFKNAKHWLVIDPGQAWGTIGDAEFVQTYTPSNNEAREVVGRIAKAGRWEVAHGA